MQSSSIFDHLSKATTSSKWLLSKIHCVCDDSIIIIIMRQLNYYYYYYYYYCCIEKNLYYKTSIKILFTIKPTVIDGFQSDVIKL